MKPLEIGRPRTPRALVTGARLPYALAIAKSLREIGYEVVATDAVWFSFTGHSKIVSAYYRTPSPRLDPSGYIGSILKIIDQEDVSLVVPSSEEVFFLSRHKAEIEQRAQLFCEAFPVLARLHSKYHVLDLARHGTASIPLTIRATDRESLRVAIRKLHHDCVIKPEYSRGGWEAIIAPKRREFDRITVSETKPWIAQARVRGTEYSSYVVAHGGRLLAHASYLPRRSAHALDLLPSLRPVRHRLISQFAAEFVQRHRLTGQFSFDFIEDDLGRLFLLECNPRATEGIFFLDAASGFGRAFLGAISQTLESASDARPLRAWDHLFDRKDIWPFLSKLPFAAETLARSLRRWVPPARALTFDLEWNGERPSI